MSDPSGGMTTAQCGHIVAYTDASGAAGVWARVWAQLRRRLPLRDVMWRTRDFAPSQVAEVHVRFVPEAAAHFAGEEMFANTDRKPSLYVFVVDGDARDEYKRRVKRELQEWLAAHAGQQYLVVVAGSAAGAAKLFQTPVVELVRSQAPRRDRVVALRLNEPQNQEQWLPLLARIKDALVEGFTANVSAVVDEAHRIKKSRTSPGWRFADYFFVKQCLARMFERSNMLRASYDQYADLQSRFRKHWRFPDASWADGLPASSTATLLDAQCDIRDRIARRTVTRFDFDQYLFAQRARLLLEMGDVLGFLHDAQEYVAAGSNRLAKATAPRAPPGFIQAWIFTAVVAVADACAAALARTGSAPAAAPPGPTFSPAFIASIEGDSETAETATTTTTTTTSASSEASESAEKQKEQDEQEDKNPILVQPPLSLQRCARLTAAASFRELPLDKPVLIPLDDSDVRGVLAAGGGSASSAGSATAAASSSASSRPERAAEQAAQQRRVMASLASFYMVARAQLSKIGVALGLSDSRCFVSSLTQALQSLELPDGLRAAAEVAEADRAGADACECAGLADAHSGSNGDPDAARTPRHQRVASLRSASGSASPAAPPRVLYFAADAGSASGSASGTATGAPGGAARSCASLDASDNDNDNDNDTDVDSARASPHAGAVPIVIAPASALTRTASASSLPGPEAAGSVESVGMGSMGTGTGAGASLERSPLSLSPLARLPPAHEHSRSLGEAAAAALLVPQAVPADHDTGDGSSSGGTGTSAGHHHPAGSLTARSPALVRKLVGESALLGAAAPDRHDAAVWDTKRPIRSAALQAGLTLRDLRRAVCDRALLAALGGRRAFAAAFVVLTERARAAYGAAGKQHTAARLARELGLVLYNTHDYAHAEPVLAAATAAFCESGWGQFALYYSLVLADCEARLARYADYADCCLRMLSDDVECDDKAYFAELLFGVAARQLAAPTVRPAPRAVLALELLAPPAPAAAPVALVSGTPATLTCRVVSRVPSPVALDTIAARFVQDQPQQQQQPQHPQQPQPAEFVMRAVCPREEHEGEDERGEEKESSSSNGSIEINPGMSEVVLRAVPGVPGVYRLDALWVECGALRLQQEVAPAFPRVAVAAPTTDLAFRALVPAWVPLATRGVDTLAVCLETHSAAVRTLACTLTADGVCVDRTAATVCTTGPDGTTRTETHHVAEDVEEDTQAAVVVRDVAPQSRVEVAHAFVPPAEPGRAHVVARAHVTDVRGATFAFADARDVAFSAPFAVRDWRRAGEPAQCLVHVCATSAAPLPLDVTRAALTDPATGAVLATGLGADPVRVEPAAVAHLVFVAPRVPAALALEVAFAFAPLPGVQCTGTWAAPLAPAPAAPRYTVAVAVRAADTPLQVCAPHRIDVRVRRNPLFLEDGAADAKEDEDGAPLMVRLAAPDGCWQLLGVRDVALAPRPTQPGAEWCHTFTAIPLRTGYLALPTLQLAHDTSDGDGDGAAPVLASPPTFVTVQPEPACLLTCRACDAGGAEDGHDDTHDNDADDAEADATGLENGGAGLAAAAGQLLETGLLLRPRVHEDASVTSDGILWPSTARELQHALAAAHVLVCWVDPGARASNPAFPLFARAIPGLAARALTVRVHVVCSLRQLRWWLTAVGPTRLRERADAGVLRFVVACGTGGSTSSAAETEALNALVYLAQVPDVAAAPVFVQCEGVPPAVAALDGLRFCTDPADLVRQATARHVPRAPAASAPAHTHARSPACPSYPPPPRPASVAVAAAAAGGAPSAGADARGTAESRRTRRERSTINLG